MSIASRSHVSARRPVLLAALALCASAAIAQAQTVTDGNSTFIMDPLNSTGAAIRTGTNGGTGTTALIAGGDTTDQLFQQYWWYRVNGVNTREFALSGRTSNVASGNTLTLDFTEPEGFTAKAKYILTDGPDVPASCNLGLSLEVVNTGAAPLDIAVFNYVDFDLEGLATDAAVLLEPGRIEVTDQTTMFKGQMLGVTPNLFQVAAFATVRNGLTDTAVTNLSNSGLPFAAADFSAAHQWNLVIPVGGRATLRGAIALNQTAVAPPSGPACIADFNGIGGVTVQDIFDFLIAWFNNAPAADVNGVGGVTVQDVFDFLTAWFNGCP